MTDPNNYCEKPNRFKLSTWNNSSLVICTYSDDKGIINYDSHVFTYFGYFNINEIVLEISSVLS